MLVRNWMQVTPVVIGGDMLLSEASRILTESKLHGLPVVDDGRLRGLITRANCLRAAHFVARAQSPDEFDFFTRRLRVKDLMVRNPATVEADDTMESCLRKGQELGVAQFPVMSKGAVVGMISANEIFSLAAHFLGAWERRSGVTLSAVELVPGVIGRIADVVESASAEVRAIYPIGVPDAGPAHDPHRKKVVVRFHAAHVGPVIAALERAGFHVIESVEAVPHAERAAA